MACLCLLSFVYEFCRVTPWEASSGNTNACSVSVYISIKLDQALQASINLYYKIHNISKYHCNYNFAKCLLSIQEQKLFEQFQPSFIQNLNTYNVHVQHVFHVWNAWVRNVQSIARANTSVYHRSSNLTAKSSLFEELILIGLALHHVPTDQCVFADTYIVFGESSVRSP